MISSWCPVSKWRLSFFGNIGDRNEYSRDGNHHDGNNHRPIALRLDDRQEYQSTMLAFSEMSQNVDALTMEMAAMKGTLDQIRNEQCVQTQQQSSKGNGKLPEGLSVRINVWDVH